MCGFWLGDLCQCDTWRSSPGWTWIRAAPQWRIASPEIAFHRGERQRRGNNQGRTAVFTCT